MRKIGALAIAGVATSLMLTFSGTAFAATITCPSTGTCSGTAGDDFISGTPAADTIDAGAGNDKVNGFAGADTITGGAGDDWVQGDAGNDTINVGPSAGKDLVGCGTGFDVVNAGQEDLVSPDCEKVNRLP
jgi:Ca2+-binding RTX toxin-like protein